MPKTDTTQGLSLFARRMREARENAGLRLDEASVDARRILGAEWGPSRETIRRYESGMISEDRADPLVVTALAEIYGVSVAYLSPTVFEQTAEIEKLLRRQRRRSEAEVRRAQEDADGEG